jgi:hypothetical protein
VRGQGIPIIGEPAEIDDAAHAGTAGGAPEVGRRFAIERRERPSAASIAIARSFCRSRPRSCGRTTIRASSSST